MTDCIMTDDFSLSKLHSHELGPSFAFFSWKNVAKDLLTWCTLTFAHPIESVLFMDFYLGSEEDLPWNNFFEVSDSYQQFFKNAIN